MNDPGCLKVCMNLARIVMLSPETAPERVLPNVHIRRVIEREGLNPTKFEPLVITLRDVLASIKGVSADQPAYRAACTTLVRLGEELGITESTILRLADVVSRKAEDELANVASSQDLVHPAPSMPVTRVDRQLYAGIVAEMLPIALETAEQRDATLRNLQAAGLSAQSYGPTSVAVQPPYLAPGEGKLLLMDFDTPTGNLVVAGGWQLADVAVDWPPPMPPFVMPAGITMGTLPPEPDPAAYFPPQAAPARPETPSGERRFPGPRISPDPTRGRG